MTAHIIAGLHRLETFFGAIQPDRLAGFVEFLSAKRLTEDEMANAVLDCIERRDSFPSAARILRSARPPGENLPQALHPIWQSGPTQLDRDVEDHGRLQALIADRERRALPNEDTLRAMRNDRDRLEERIARRHQLASEQSHMLADDAAIHAIKFWGAERHLPTVLRALSTPPDVRNRDVEPLL